MMKGLDKKCNRVISFVVCHLYARNELAQNSIQEETIESNGHEEGQTHIRACTPLKKGEPCDNMTSFDTLYRFTSTSTSLNLYITSTSRSGIRTSTSHDVTSH